ncbi:MAG: zinc-dependent metalloprotease [Cytophagales bacterium]|nr:zinc-dependent metalloprotease [Cytophagales bacterium]
MFRITKIILIIFIISTVESISKDKKQPLADTSKTVKVPKKKKSFDDSLKAYIKYEGLFKFYQDTSTGNVLMVIRKGQLDKDYIYFSYTENGPVSVGHFKGNFRDNKIFRIKKYFNKIEFVEQNHSYYFDPKNELSKASNANISPSVIFSQKISDTDLERGEYLVPAEDLLLSEALHRIKPQPPRGVPPDAYFNMGTLSKAKSKVLKIRPYPQNADIIIEYVFENQYPSASGGAGVTDERNVSIVLQHSFIQVPQNDYKPRYDDARVGYFTTMVNDMTSASTTPYRDMIHRWHLKKKNPEMALSEPVEPIIWWVENTTPQRYRKTIIDAGLMWNKAFETAGFINAIQIKVQPDTATWDAGDIRYNVLRWTSSPAPPFGGYGPSFVNPLTGQILGSDIMLEYAFITNRLKLQQFFETNNTTSEHPTQCAAAHHLQHQLMLGKMAMAATDTDADTTQLITEAIYYLILHEMGHTLGLNHNMRASQMLTYKELYDKDLIAKKGLTASVMDYPAINILPEPDKQTAYYTTQAGPYDHWAIAYGYTTYESDEAEKQGLEKLLHKSTDKDLAFGNDADDMRTPGLHIDPRVMINDMSANSIDYMKVRMTIVNNMAKKLKTKYIKVGKSYEALRNGYFITTQEIANAGAVVSRYIGGIYTERYKPEQSSSAKPYTPVPYAEQKKAMSLLQYHIFGAQAFQLNYDLYQYLQPQRRGFSMYGQNEDPKIHDRVLQIQRSILDHLLHPNVLKRLTDTELYGNKYSQTEMLTDLTAAIMSGDGAVINGFRKNIQTEYVLRMVNASKTENNTYDYISKANMTVQLKRIQAIMSAKVATDAPTKAHCEYLLFIIAKALAVK